MFYLPAEWAPQQYVLLIWPHSATDWQPRLTAIESFYFKLTKQITLSTRVLLICPSSDFATTLKPRLLQHDIDADRLDFVVHQSNDTWARDCGPITVIDQAQRKFVDFIFNGWGQKFDAQRDNQIPQRLLSHFPPEIALQSIDYVLEGGSIDSNGNGALLTTESCLLHPQRNPDLTKADYEQLFKNTFNTQITHWLKHSTLEGDDTDGHIDMLARFGLNNTILHTSCNDPEDVHYAELQAMQQELAGLKNIDGKSYELHALPIPAAIYNQAGERLPASYANFLITNQQVLVPIYHDKNDAIAMERITHCFPGYRVQGLDCRTVIEQGGSLHCLTMQIPQIGT